MQRGQKRRPGMLFWRMTKNGPVFSFENRAGEIEIDGTILSAGLSGDAGGVAELPGRVVAGIKKRPGEAPDLFEMI